MERLKNTVFELAFALTSDNQWMGYFDFTAMLIDGIQLLAFAFSPKYKWGVLDFQNALQYTVRPWPVIQVSFYAVTAVVLFSLLSLILLMKQLSSHGVINSVRLLMVTRLVMAVSSTILFIPFLETYLTVFKKDLGYVTPDGDLDGSALYVAQSVVYLVIFFVIVTTFSLLYIIPDPLESKDLTSRVTTRPVILDLFGRTLIVCIQNLTEDPVFLAVVYWAVMLMTLCMSLVYPYYLRQSINRSKIGMAGALWFLSNFSLYVSTNPQENVTLFVAACVTTVLSIPIFVVLAEFRFKLINPCRGGKELSSSYYKRLYFVTDYALATRVFCSRSVGLNEMLTAISIFEEGLKRYPASDYLHARFAIYLVFVAKERLKVLRSESRNDVDYLKKLDKQVSHQVADIIKKIFRMKPLLDLQYSFFYVAAKLEQERYAVEAGKPRLNIIESIRFKHDIKTALHHHRLANETILSFWKSIRLEQEQREHLVPLLAQEFRKHSATSETYYGRLLQQFPNSEYVWDNYIVFTSDVMRDEKRAMQMEQQRKALKNSGEVDIEGSNMSIRDGNLYETLAQGLGKDNDVTKSDKWHLKSNALWLSMVCNLALLIFGQIFLIIYSDLKPSPEVGTMASTRRFGQTTLFYARQVEIFCNHGKNYLPTSSLAGLQSQILNLSLETASVSYRVKQDPAARTFAPLRDAWNAKTGTRFVRPVPWIKRNTSIDAMSFIDAYVSHGITFASTNLTHCVRDVPLPLDVAGIQPSALVNNSDWTFLVDNAKLEYLLSQFGVVSAIQDLHHYTVDQNRNVLTIVYACASGIPLLVTLFFVLPAFRSFKWERLAIMKLFFKFESRGIETIVVQRKDVLFSGSQRGQRVEENRKRSRMSLASESSSVDTADISNSNLTKVTKRSPHSKMLFSYFISMCVLLAFMAGIIVVVYQTSAFLRTTANEANWNAARRSLGARMVALSQELIRGDTTIWENREEIRSYLSEHLGLLVKAHVGLRNGDKDLGLPGFANRYKPQDDVSFKRTCDENKIECFSLDEAYALYLENIRAILYTPDSELSLDMPRFRQSIDMIFGDMGTKLATSARLLLDEAYPVVDQASYVENIFVALCVPFCIVSILFLTRMRNQINDEIDAFRQILNMVPFEYLKTNKDAFRYVKYAKISISNNEMSNAVDGKTVDDGNDGATKKPIRSEAVYDSNEIEKSTSLVAIVEEIDDNEDASEVSSDNRKAHFKSGNELVVVIQDDPDPESMDSNPEIDEVESDKN